MHVSGFGNIPSHVPTCILFSDWLDRKLKYSYKKRFYCLGWSRRMLCYKNSFIKSHYGRKLTTIKFLIRRIRYSIQ